MNERDSEAVAAQLVAKGYTLAPSERVADVVLLNTCSVRDAAEQKAIGKMQNLAADVRKNRPEVILGFMGCMAQSRGQSLIDKLPDVDLVLGTQKFHRAAGISRGAVRRAARQDCGRGGGGGERGENPRARPERRRGAGRHRLRQHHARLQSILHLLHRALHARRGAQPHHSRHRGRVPRTRRARCAGNHPARPDRHELRKARLEFKL